MTTFCRDCGIQTPWRSPGDPTCLREQVAALRGELDEARAAVTTFQAIGDAAESRLAEAQTVMAEFLASWPPMGKHLMTEDFRACLPDCPGCIEDGRYVRAVEAMRALLSSQPPSSGTSYQDDGQEGEQ